MAPRPTSRQYKQQIRVWHGCFWASNAKLGCKPWQETDTWALHILRNILLEDTPKSHILQENSCWGLLTYLLHSCLHMDLHLIEMRRSTRIWIMGLIYDTHFLMPSGLLQTNKLRVKLFPVLLVKTLIYFCSATVFIQMRITQLCSTLARIYRTKPEA